MAYDGYLLRLGSYTVPENKYIKHNSYSAYRNVQDLDSYRDADGILHRNALSHAPIKIEFETPAMLTHSQLADFISHIRANYLGGVNDPERKISATAYIPELDSYVTQDVYMSDIKPSIYGSGGGVLRYNSIRFAFIGY